MGALVKNLHFLIIAMALFNIFNLWSEKTEILDGLIVQTDSLSNTVKNKEKSKKEINKFFTDINEAKDRIERVASEIEKIQQQLPTEVNDGDVINFVTKKADELNIREVNITPSLELEDRGFYKIKKFIFKAKGTYVQFLILFENIADYKLILNIGKVEFSRNSLMQRSRFQIIDGQFEILAYQYNSDYKEDRGFDKIEQQSKGKFDSKKDGSPKKKGGGGED
jgi:Tfp pilus assembly protein PilO